MPVKPLRRAKSRLSGVLTNLERESLSRRLLEHTLQILGELPEVESTLVVSRDSHALAIARKAGARTLTEHGASELNRALKRATVVASEYGASGVLILPADLPLLTSEDVGTLISAAQDPPVVVLVPDRRAEGTNALLVRPPGILTYDFGPGSFIRHQEQAREAGARVEICHLDSLALDLDLPEDLERLQDQLDLEESIPQKE